MNDVVGEVAGEPRLFTRVIVIPPGAPWTQLRAAKLEVEHGAPLPLGELVSSLRRIGPWRPQSVARFAIAYLRREQAGGHQKVAALIDGAPFEFVFRPAGLAALKRPELLVAGLALLAVVGLSLAGAKATRVKSDNEAMLARLELNAKAAERKMRRQGQLERDAAIVKRSGMDRGTFADVAADLAWLGQNRTSSAVVRSVSWKPAGLIVMADGADPPVSDRERQIERLAASSGSTEWRIGHAPAPVMKSGVAVPSIVSRPRRADTDPR